MIKSYWDCKFADCDDYWDNEDGRVWIYGCNHPDNKNHYCDLDNKWGCQKDNCVLLEEKQACKSSPNML